MFLATNFFRGEPPNFWTYIIQIDADTSHVGHMTSISMMWQSFAAIGRRSSEILWLIKK